MSLWESVDFRLANARRPLPCRLRLEALEDRALLSVCTVDRLTDNNPVGGGEGGGGMGDLRYCITHATDGDDITFGVTGTINLAGALPSLTHNIGIYGPGADLATVRRDTGGNYGIFTVGTGVTASISGLTISNGDGVFGGGISNFGTLNVNDATLNGNFASQEGGGIYNDGSVGVLTVSDSTISGNSCSSGGGISNFGTLTVTGSSVSSNSSLTSGGGIISNENLTIINSTISGNSAKGGGGGIENSGIVLTIISSNVANNTAGVGFPGGGIANTGTLTVTNSSITGNSGGIGGGIYSSSGALVITNSTLSGNTADQNGPASYGGGIYNGGTLTVTNSTLSGNSAGSSGGGIYNGGTLTVTNSTLSGNSAGSSGGGIYNGGMLTINNSTISENTSANEVGGVSNVRGSLNIIDSTISGNTAGGINSAGGSLTVLNSTVSGNGGAGGISYGAGGTVTITDSTITGNSATINGGGISGFGLDYIRNTIIAGNTAPIYPDIYSIFNSKGHNLIGDGTGGMGYDPTDLVGTSQNPIDPMLGLLQNNGGPTQTKALLPGSPVLNAGDTTELGIADQRGVIRTGGVNIGAYQASAAAFVLTAPAKVTAGTPFDVTVTAVDPFGQVAFGYTGTIAFSSADPYGASLPANYTFQLSDRGQATFPAGATLYTAGTWDVTATDTSSGITGTALVNVQAAPAVALQIVAPTTADSGTPFDVTVIAVDPYGNTDTNYLGTVTFSSSDPDPGVILPTDYTFQPGDQGTAFFPGGVTLISPGDQTVTATDTVSAISGIAVITVSSTNIPAPAGVVVNVSATPATVPAQLQARQATKEPSESQPARTEAASAPVSLALDRRARDAAFEGWADPFVDGFRNTNPGFQLSCPGRHDSCEAVETCRMA